MLENLKSNLLQLHMRKPVQVKRRRRSEEADHQKAFFRWLTLYDKSIRALTFHIPNGGSRNIREAKSLRAQGVTGGVPDIFCAIPAFGFNGLWIEFKSKQGTLSSKQKEMGTNLKRMGYQVSVAYSWFEARDMLLNYLRVGGIDDRQLSA